MARTRIFASVLLYGFLFYFIVTAGEALAATYYISPSGSDSSNGVASAPFRTVQKAADVVAAGDTVYVRAGIYNERVVLTKSGAPGAYITFQNYPGETVYLDGTGRGNGVMFKGTNVSYIKVIGLKIRNFIGGGIAFEATGTYDGSHIEIRNNEIYSNTFQSVWGHGILINTYWPLYGGNDNTWTDLIVDGNNLHDLDTGGNEALTICGDIERFQITNNTIARVSFIGIVATGRGFDYPRNGIMSGNTVSQINLNPHDNGGSAIEVDGAQLITMENNTVYNIASYNGIVTSNEDKGNSYGTGATPIIAENIIVRRNKIYNVANSLFIGGGYWGTSQNSRYVHNTCVVTTTGKHSCFYLGKGSGHIAKNNVGYFSSSGTFYMIQNAWNITTNHTLDYNNYYPATGVYYWYGDNNSIYSSFSAYKAAKNQDNHSITSNPLFTNLGAFDLTLQSGSPAIDAGDFLTRTTSSGSGTVITVGDARYFHDGYGISGVPGDTIRVGGDIATITDVNYSTNTITVNKSISWISGAGVSYAYSGSAPDIGAYEYGVTTNP